MSYADVPPSWPTCKPGKQPPRWRSNLPSLQPRDRAKCSGRGGRMALRGRRNAKLRIDLVLNFDDQPRGAHRLQGARGSFAGGASAGRMGAYERSMLEGYDFTDVAKGNVAYCCMEYRTFDGFVFPMRHRNRRSVAHTDRHRVQLGRAWPNCRRPNPAWLGASSKRVNVKGGLSATRKDSCFGRSIQH